MTAEKDDLQEVRLNLKIDGKTPDRNEEGVPLVDGRPINELLRTDPEFFQRARAAFAKALGEALGVDPNAEPREIKTTPTRDVDWDQLKTFGPEDILDSVPSEKAGKKPEER